MKWLLVLVLVLNIPVEIWKNIPESERDKLVTHTIIDHCQKEAERTGIRKFRIFDEIKDGFYRLTIDPVKTEA